MSKRVRLLSEPFDAPRAFTLVEILVVSAILTILMCLVVSATSGARRSGYVAQTTSNLHQVWTALALYQEEQGEWPTGSQASKAVSTAPTCDAMDAWRSNCTIDLGDPMLGSYAYAFHVPLFRAEPSALSEYLSAHDNPAILVSLFPLEHRIVRFAGESPDASLCRPLNVCIMPPHVIAAYKDGSVRRAITGPKYESNLVTGPLITWSSLFDCVSPK